MDYTSDSAKARNQQKTATDNAINSVEMSPPEASINRTIISALKTHHSNGVYDITRLISLFPFWDFWLWTTESYPWSKWLIAQFCKGTELPVTPHGRPDSLWPASDLSWWLRKLSMYPLAMRAASISFAHAQGGKGVVHTPWQWSREVPSPLPFDFQSLGVVTP